LDWKRAEESVKLAAQPMSELCSLTQIEFRADVYWAKSSYRLRPPTSAAEEGQGNNNDEEALWAAFVTVKMYMKTLKARNCKIMLAAKPCKNDLEVARTRYPNILFEKPEDLDPKVPRVWNSPFT
jgi:hypothetical protein